MIKKKQIRNNKVEVTFRFEKGNTNTDLIGYYENEFPHFDRGIYNPITFFKSLKKYIQKVYELGKRNNGRWNSRYGYTQQIKHFIRFELVRRYDDFYKTYQYHIEEKVYLGEYSHSMWKDNSTPSFHRIENNIFKIDNLLGVINNWLMSWDKVMFEDKLIEILLKPLKEFYNINDVEDMVRKWNDLDIMLKESDKNIERVSQRNKKESDKINRLYKKGLIDETEWLIMSSKVGNKNV